MSTALTWICALTLLAGADGLQPGLKLVVQGELRPVVADRTGPVVKQFTCTFIVLRGRPEAGYEVGWFVEDQIGEPRWTWEQRFGRCWVNPDLVIPPDRFGPAILAHHATSVHRIPVRFPVIPVSLLREEPPMFRQLGLEYNAAGEETVDGRRLLRVEGSSNLAVREVLWVDPATGYVYRQVRRLTMGQGVPYQLTVKLVSAEQLDEAELDRTVDVIEQLEQLRGEEPEELSKPVTRPATEEQLKAAQALVAVLEKSPLPLAASVLEQAVREIDQQLKTRSDVDKLARGIVGKEAPDFELRDLLGRTVRLRDLRGKVVVLHFWSYGDEVLEAPYGEVGYLDYIVRRFRDKGVVVLGVATQNDLLDATRRARALRRIRQFTRFMNLSYPVLIDDLGVIDRFGDPRRVKGQLPLYVVIDRDGVVRAYHAGHWAAAPDQGLVELETLLSGLISPAAEDRDAPGR